MLNSKRDKGITLVALVITTIVLLILAGVTINALSGDNGLLKRAAEAKKKTEEGTIKEKIELLLVEYKINNINNKEELLEKFLESKLNIDYVIPYGNTGYTFNYDGYKIVIDKITLEVLSIQKEENLKKYFVGDYGAIGDGITNDFEAIQRAVDDCYSNGGGSVTFDGNKTYLLKRPSDWSTDSAYHTTCAINLKPGVNIEGNGCAIEWYHTNGVFNTNSRERIANTVAKLTENVEKNADYIVVDSTENYSSGDVIALFGEDNETGDKYETKDWMFNKIVNIDSQKIYLENKINFKLDLNLCGQTGILNTGIYNGAIMKVNIYENTFIINCTISNHGNGSGASIYLSFAKNVQIDNIKGIDLNKHITSLQFCENVELNNYQVEYFNTAGAGDGVFGLYECKDITIQNSNLENFYGTVLNGESYDKNIIFKNCKINLNNENLLNLDVDKYRIFSTTIGCSISLENVEIECNYDNVLIQCFDYVKDGKCKYKDLTIVTQEKLNLFNIKLKDISGYLKLICNDQKTLYDFDNPVEYNIRLNASNNFFEKQYYSNNKGFPIEVSPKLENCTIEDIKSIIIGEGTRNIVNIKDYIDESYTGLDFGRYTEEKKFLDGNPYIQASFNNTASNTAIVIVNIKFIPEQKF